MTAANSSSISDGAAALVLMRRSDAERRGLKPLAVIVAHATHAQEPAWFSTAPVGAIEKLYEKTGWTTKDVDLFEINEAFAVVTMAAMKEHGLPHDKVNVHGGATRAGPSDRRVGRADHRHAARRAAQARQEARRGGAVHRRRRSDGDGDRTRLTRRRYERPRGDRMIPLDTWLLFCRRVRAAGR